MPVRFQCVYNICTLTNPHTCLPVGRFAHFPRTGREIRTPINGFGDRYSAIELCPIPQPLKGSSDLTLKAWVKKELFLKTKYPGFPPKYFAKL